MTISEELTSLDSKMLEKEIELRELALAKVTLYIRVVVMLLGFTEDVSKTTVKRLRLAISYGASNDTLRAIIRSGR